MSYQRKPIRPNLTEAGRLRNSKFVGLREDKDALKRGQRAEIRIGGEIYKGLADTQMV
jgi:hypothetical protein